jgi:hypothetical protein
MIAKPDSTDKAAWLQMQTVLHADKLYLQYITENSKASRHGKHNYITGEVVTKVVERSWIIMNRYLEYRKRGNKPLTAPEFPLLIQ